MAPVPASLHGASAGPDLLVSIELPAVGLHCLMRFPTHASKVECDQDLLHRVSEFVLEAALEMRELGMSEVDPSGTEEKLDQLRQHALHALEDWRAKQRAAEEAIARVERVQKNMNSMRESYLKEVMQLREQINLKGRAQQAGQEFQAEDICIFDPAEYTTSDEIDTVVKMKAQILQQRFDEQKGRLFEQLQEKNRKLETMRLLADRKDRLLHYTMHQLRMQDEKEVERRMAEKEQAAASNPKTLSPAGTVRSLDSILPRIDSGAQAEMADEDEVLGPVLGADAVASPRERVTPARRLMKAGTTTKNKVLQLLGLERGSFPSSDATPGATTPDCSPRGGDGDLLAQMPRRERRTSTLLRLLTGGRQGSLDSVPASDRSGSALGVAAGAAAAEFLQQRAARRDTEDTGVQTDVPMVEVTKALNFLSEYMRREKHGLNCGCRCGGRPGCLFAGAMKAAERAELELVAVAASRADMPNRPSVGSGPTSAGSGVSSPSTTYLEAAQGPPRMARGLSGCSVQGVLDILHKHGVPTEGLPDRDRERAESPRSSHHGEAAMTHRLSHRAPGSGLRRYHNSGPTRPAAPAPHHHCHSDPVIEVLPGMLADQLSVAHRESEGPKHGLRFQRMARQSQTDNFSDCASTSSKAHRHHDQGDDEAGSVRDIDVGSQRDSGHEGTADMACRPTTTGRRPPAPPTATPHGLAALAASLPIPGAGRWSTGSHGGRRTFNEPDCHTTVSTEDRSTFTSQGKPLSSGASSGSLRSPR